MAQQCSDLEEKYSQSQTDLAQTSAFQNQVGHSKKNSESMHYPERQKSGQSWSDSENTSPQGQSIVEPYLIMQLKRNV